MINPDNAVKQHHYSTHLPDQKISTSSHKAQCVLPFLLQGAKELAPSAKITIDSIDYYRSTSYPVEIKLEFPKEMINKGVLIDQKESFAMCSVLYERYTLKDENSKLNAAAKKIQTAWHHYQFVKNQKEAYQFDLFSTEARQTLYQTIHLLKKTRDFTNPQLEQCVLNCLMQAQSTNDRLALRWLSYALFSGPQQTDANPVVKALIFVLNDPDASTDTIAPLIYHLFNQHKQTHETFGYVNQEQKQNSKTPSKEIPWTSKVNHVDLKPITPDSSIYISHGGGLFFLMQFLMGETAGYSANQEYEGEGIFVTPKLEPGGAAFDDSYYANWHPSQFDIPAVLMAQTKAQNLGAVPNTYEAVLRQSTIPQLTDVTIKILPYKARTLAPSQEELEKSIPNPHLRKSVQESIDRYALFDYVKEGKEQIKERKIQKQKEAELKGKQKAEETAKYEALLKILPPEKQAILKGAIAAIEKQGFYEDEETHYVYFSVDDFIDFLENS